MALEFIGSDQPISAEKWNEFFAELDRKTTLVMDGKSLLLLQGVTGFSNIASLFGIFFFFIRQGTSWTTFRGNQKAYNHQPFTDAAAAVDVSMFDSAKKIVSTDEPIDVSYWEQVDTGAGDFFFNRSLEAHTRMFQEPDKEAAPYWIIERSAYPSYRPEKVNRYAQAEILIEGEGWADFQMDQRWNKYNFFRFHNLTAYAVTVSFAGYHSIVIPRWESRCVRRSAVDSGYLDGWNYFHRFKTGDPRVLEMPHSNSTPHGSMGANNVISPALVYRFLDVLAGPYLSPVTGQFAFGCYRDPHELYDVAASWSRTAENLPLYPQFPIVADGVLIGDLLHHAGTLESVKVVAGLATKTALEFEGYAALKAGAWSPEGVSVTQNPDGTITLGTTAGVTHDLWGTGSNLLGVPMGSLNTGIVLRTAVPESGSVIPAAGASNQDVRAWTRLEADGAGNVTLDGQLTATVTVQTTVQSESSTGNNPNAIAIHSYSVADVLTLDAWGDPAYPGQSNAWSTFEDRAVTLTPFGLALTFSHRVPVALHPAWIVGSIDLRLDSAAADGTDLVFQKSITFDGYGWATTAQPAFIGPRKARVVSSVPSDTIEFLTGDFTPGPAFELVNRHPSISGQPQGANGADFAVIPYKKTKKASDTTGIFVLTSLALEWPTDFGLGFDNPFDFQIYPADVLDEFDRDSTLAGYVAARARYLENEPAERRAVRLNLLREHFNCLVVSVNALKKAEPFTYDLFEFNLPRSNTVGPFGGAYCPANQYCSFAQNSTAHVFFQALGLPVKTIADLPASFAAVKAAKQMRLRLRTNYHESLTFKFNRTSGASIFPNFEAKMEIGETVAAIEPPDDFSPSLLTAAIFGVSANPNDPFYWVTVEDVQAASEAAGFKFVLERQAVPYMLKMFTVEAATEERLFLVPNHVQQFEVGPFIFNPPGAELNEDQFLNRDDFVQNAVYALMTEAVEGESAEWIREVGIARLIDHRSGDDDTALPNIIHSWQVPQNSAAILTVTLGSQALFIHHYGAEEYRLLRQRADIVRTTPFSVQAGATEIEPVRRRASILVQSWVSSGLIHSGTMILARSPWITYNGEQFSRQSLTNAIGRLTYGPTVIPLYAPPSSVGAVAVTLSSQKNLVIARTDAIPPIVSDLLTCDSTLVTVDSTLITCDTTGTEGSSGGMDRYALDTLWVRDWPLLLG